MTPEARPFPIGWFSILMLLDVTVLLIEKTASIRAVGQGLTLLISYATQPWVWLILAIKLGQLRAWTVLLTRMDLSMAFPLTALAIPIGMGAAVVVFGDQLGWRIWLGSMLITAGAIAIGPTESPSSDEMLGSPI
jgi:drug/metabolite transporter (DMT)-like permease